MTTTTTNSKTTKVLPVNLNRCAVRRCVREKNGGARIPFTRCNDKIHGKLRESLIFPANTHMCDICANTICASPDCYEIRDGFTPYCKEHGKCEFGENCPNPFFAVVAPVGRAKPLCACEGHYNLSLDEHDKHINS